MKPFSEYREDIQLLRGIAVAAVLLYHGFEGVFVNGLLGVDVFFVISGFVVGPLLVELTHSNSLRMYLQLFYKFVRNRFFRLAPALFATLILSALIIVIFSRIGDLSRISKQAIYTMFLSGNIGAYKFSGDYFQPTPNPLIHTWSLAVEEQIYLFLPIILVATLLARGYEKQLAGLILLFVGFASFSVYLLPNLMQPAYAYFGINETNWAGFYLPISRIWEFLAGFSTHFFKKLNKQKSYRNCVFQFARSVILVMLLLTPVRLDSRLLGLMIVIATCAIINSRDLYVLNGTFQKSFCWMGDRSYSIYLVHMPLIYIPLHSPVYESFQISGVFGIALAILMSVFLGNTFFILFENRFRIRRGVNDSNSEEIRKKFVFTLILWIVPLTIFSGLISGSNNRFWGLDKNLEIPPYAGFLDPNCERDSRDGPPCRYVNFGAERTVLLIGDSHAGHLSQVVIDASKSGGWNSIIWTHSACRFELSESVPDWCRRVNHQILDYVQSSRPDIVLLSQANDAKSNLESAINSLVKLKSVSKQLVLIHETPRFNDLKYMNSGSLLQEPYLPPKFERIDMKFEDYFITANKIYLNKQLEGAKILNINDIFCKKQICFRWNNGNWLFRDQSHLSVDGAEMASEKISNLLNGN